MIVVDTNVIAYLYVSSAHTAAAERALLKDPAWAAPLPWPSELRKLPRDRPLCKTRGA